MSNNEVIEVLDHGYVSIPWDAEQEKLLILGSDHSIVNAARASFQKQSQKWDERDDKLLRWLMKENETSPFRHALITFEVKAPLFVARQWWKYIVGSDHCQPEGTKVAVVTGKSEADGRTFTTEQRDISEIKKGDRVVCFDNIERQSYIFRSGKEVTDVWSRRVWGLIYKVSAKNKTSKYTKDHPCIAKFGDVLKNKFVVYLMRRGDQYRIGQTMGYRGDGAIGLRVRCKAEGADASWILGVFDNVEEARLHESLWASKYGIPTLLFKASAKGHNQNFYDSFWSLLGSNYTKAKLLLEHLGLLITEPIFERNFRERFNRDTKLKIAACNLLPGMLMMVDDGTSKGYENFLWHPISIETELYDGMVYSLKVDEAHTYFADGILTHNCMDGWNEASRRYVTLDPEFYTPNKHEWRSQPANKKQGSGQVLDEITGTLLEVKLATRQNQSLQDYQDAMDLYNVAAEEARLFLLAYGMYVSWRWTASLNSICHLINQRLHHKAQHEFQLYAQALVDLVRPHFPTTIDALVKETK